MSVWNVNVAAWTGSRMAEQRAALVQRDPELRGQRGALVGGGSEAEQGGTEPPTGAPKRAAGVRLWSAALECGEGGGGASVRAVPS